MTNPIFEERQARRREFCARFVAEHHPSMTDAAEIEGARPLVPLGAVRRIRVLDDDLWLQTDDSICGLGAVYLGCLFDCRGLLDHDWMIGRDHQEPSGLVSEPYAHVTQDNVEALRGELENAGAELLVYLSEQATHNTGVLPLVANITDIHRLAAAVARLIVNNCEPPWSRMSAHEVLNTGETP